MNIFDSSMDYGTGTLLIIFDEPFCEETLDQFINKNYSSFFSNGYSFEIKPPSSFMGLQNYGSVYVDPPALDLS